MISAVVCTKNSQDRIQKCLESLLWCDEIVVVDDFSTDHTQNKVKALKSIRIHLYTHALNADFAAQHNFGLSVARHDWVLFVDDDEHVNTILVQEIKQALTNKHNVGYYFHRQDWFWGRKLFFGETSNVKLLRLGRQGKGLWKRKVHEYWDIGGPTANMQQPIDHYPHPRLSQFIESINCYTTIDAEVLNNEGKPFSLWKVLVYPFAKFLHNYVFRLGFLDGLPGFVMAYMMSFYSLTVRVKQYDLFRSS